MKQFQGYEQSGYMYIRFCLLWAKGFLADVVVFSGRFWLLAYNVLFELHFFTNVFKMLSYALQKFCQFFGGMKTLSDCRPKSFCIFTLNNLHKTFNFSILEQARNL